jgi:hypothetical protein
MRHLKSIIRQLVVSTFGFLAALLLYHYHLALAHLVADGFTAIPWHSKYFWPIGGPWWVLPVLTAVAVALGTYQWKFFDDGPEGLTIPLFVLGILGGCLVAMGAFASGYIVLGLICSAGFIATIAGSMARELQY